VAIEALVERAKLAPGEDVRVEQLASDANTSHHLVTLRDREPLHRHDRHAITVFLLRGHGRMHIAGAERPLGERSVLYVGRGVVHAFINETSDSPAVAYVIYSPPYNGGDRILVEPTEPTVAPE